MAGFGMDNESVPSLQNKNAFGGVPAAIRVPRGDLNLRSVGGASVASVGSAAVFQHCTCHTLLEIEHDEVVVRKEDCGLPGTKTYADNCFADTQSLAVKFLGSFHLLSKNADGENVQKLKHIQDKFVLNLEVVKKFKEWVQHYDMRTPLQVPAVFYNVVGEDAWEG